MKELVSVIVPIYNIEDEIGKCIESIISQTYRNLEIILVDDGSTDKSLSICHKYAADDKRIKVIHKKNEGLVSARKAGMQAASGSYVAHIDGDDWVEEGYIETLVNGTDSGNVDVVIAGFLVESVDGSVEKIQNKVESGLYDKEDIKQFIYPVLLEGIFPSNCSKLFRRELAFEKQMLVEDCVECDEDTVAVYPILLNALSIRIIDACQYHYVRRTNSLSTYGTDASTFFDTVRNVYEALKKEFLGHEEKKMLMLQLERLVSSRVVAGVSRYYAISIQKYMFPYEMVAPKSRIVLYGAGAVGRDFYRQITKNQYCEIIIWVDQNYKMVNIPYAEVKSPTAILAEQYDYVIVCVNGRGIALDITKKLNDMGISDQQIVWSKDYITDLNIRFS